MTIVIILLALTASHYFVYRKGRVDGACSVHLIRRVIGGDNIDVLHSKYFG